jgi:hypothetical protein
LIFPKHPAIYLIYKPFQNFSDNLSLFQLKDSDLARVLGGQGPAVALTDSVAIRTSVLTVVGGVALGPGASVHAAVGSLRRSVLAQDVRVEEVAGIVGSIAARVLVRVLIGGDTSTSALVRVVGSSVVSGAHVTTWSLDSSSEFGRCAEVLVRGRRGQLVETHGASYDDLEAVAPLSVVGSSSSVNLRAPQRALAMVSIMSTRTCDSYSP